MIVRMVFLVAALLGLNVANAMEAAHILPKTVAPIHSEKTIGVPVEGKTQAVWKTLLTDKPVTFTGVNFDTNSVVLLAGAKSKLDDIAEFSKLYPHAQLSVSGYADYRAGKSSKAYNQKLSARRASAFKAALVARGVAANRITSAGFGFDKPIADNKTPAGRSQNRRVEISSLIKVENKVQVTK